MATKATKPVKPTGKLAAVQERDLSEYGNFAMKRYGTEVNEQRAIPALQDGFKPVTRRLIWAARSVAQKQSKSARLVGQCFAPGTQVLLPGGKSLPIEDLIVGDEVQTDLGPEVVAKVFDLPPAVLYEVTTDAGTVKATPDQIFYCLAADGNEVERTPLTLKPGDRIKRAP